MKMLDDTRRERTYNAGSILQMSQKFEKNFDRVKELLLPLDDWEKLSGETSAAFDAFRAFRDYGAGRNLKVALLGIENDTRQFSKLYRQWRNWSAKYRWFKRASDYDAYIDRVKLAERRKTIEDREKKHLEVSGRMLDLSSRRLEMAKPEELTLNNAKDFAEAAIGIERTALDIPGDRTIFETTGAKQFELNFSGEFKDL
jgi:hypothetical protein